MKQTLIIGSTCTDITLNIPHFPVRGGDENISAQHMTLGGCAYNVSDILHKSELPYTLCSPVGTGMYGKFVETKLTEKGVTVFAHINDLENGCCYNIVDNDGERTFLAKHGAEYRFRAEWFSSVDWKNVDSMYFCGLEVEDADGKGLVSFIEDCHSRFVAEGRKLVIFFSPGPRIAMIDRNLLDRIFAINPILHLNIKEAAAYTGTNAAEQSSDILHKATGNSVIITSGAKGAYCFDHNILKGFFVPGFKARTVDSSGAGDAHCGTVIASLKQGYTLMESVMRANKLASALVTIPGTTIPEKFFEKALLCPYKQKVSSIREWFSRTGETGTTYIQ